MFVFKKKSSQALEDPAVDSDESYGDNEEEVLKNIRNKLKAPSSKVVPYQNLEEKQLIKKESEDSKKVIDDFDHDEKEESLIEDMETSDEHADEEEEDIIEEEEENDENLEEEQTLEQEQEKDNEDVKLTNEDTNIESKDLEKEDLEEDVNDEATQEEDADNSEYQEEQPEEEIDNTISDIDSDLEKEIDEEIEEIAEENDAQSDEEGEEELYDEENEEAELSEDEIDAIIEEQIEIQKKQQKEDINGQELMADNTAKQVQDKVGELLSTVKNLQSKPNVYQNAQDISLISLIEPILKDQIKIWMDSNFAKMVNNIVTAEIKRLLPDEHK